MPDDLTIHRGDLFWLRPEAASNEIAHPHVVLQDDVFNHSRLASVIVCGLTTNLHRVSEPGDVLLESR